jgi:hypothetical protein
MGFEADMCRQSARGCVAVRAVGYTPSDTLTLTTGGCGYSGKSAILGMR